MTDTENKRRERAYHIWESEGRPEGLQLEHWRMAEDNAEATEEAAAEVAEANHNASDMFNGEHKETAPADIRPPSTLSPD